MCDSAACTQGRAYLQRLGQVIQEVLHILQSNRAANLHTHCQLRAHGGSSSTTDQVLSDADGLPLLFGNGGVGHGGPVRGGW